MKPRWDFTGFLIVMHLEGKPSLSAVWYTLTAASGTINEMQDKNSANLRNGNNFGLKRTNAEIRFPNNNIMPLSLKLWCNSEYNAWKENLNHKQTHPKQCAACSTN